MPPASFDAYLGPLERSGVVPKRVKRPFYYQLSRVKRNGPKLQTSEHVGFDVRSTSAIMINFLL